MSDELQLIPAKVLGERDYGDKDKVKIIVPSRCSPDAYDNDGIDPNTQEDFTQEAVVACNNKLGKDSLVWISYLDDAETQPIIIRVFWGKTDYDTFNFGDSTGPNDNDDPNAIQLECGISLAELAVDVVASAERNYKWTSLNKRIEEEAYAQENPDNVNRALGIRQWNGSRAKSVLKYVYNQDPKQSKKIAGKYNSQIKAYDGVKNISKEVSNRISKILSTSYGKEAQRTCARTGKGDSGYGLAKLIDYGVKKGITNNASLLFFAELCNGYGTKAQWDKMAKYGKGDKSFKQFYEDLKSKNPKVPGVKGPMDSKPYNYLGRRKLVYHNIKMLEDAGWLKGKAGNLTNITNASSSNSTTGWIYPISDKNEEFKVTGKWKTSNGIKITSSKSEGKVAVAVYTGTIKKIETKGQTVNIYVQFRTKDNKKHYVEYIGLQRSDVTKGENISKGASIGKLTSSGLIFRVHKTSSKDSIYVNPKDYIGSNKKQKSEEEPKPSGKVKKSIIIPKSLNQTGLTNADYTHFETQRWVEPCKKVFDAWKKKGRKGKRRNATIDGYYLVATKPKFGAVGDRIDIILRDNTVIQCIQADTKGNEHPPGLPPSPWGHYKSGNKVSVVEFEYMNATYGAGKGIALKDWANKKVKRIDNKGKYIK